jgi:hypothetical protein
VPKWQAPYILVKIVSYFDPEVKHSLGKMYAEYWVDNKKSKELLGMEYRDPLIGVIDQLKSLIEAGIIENKMSPKL